MTSLSVSGYSCPTVTVNEDKSYSHDLGRCSDPLGTGIWGVHSGKLLRPVKVVVEDEEN